MSVDARGSEELPAAVFGDGGFGGEPVEAPVCDVGKEADVFACWM